MERLPEQEIKRLLMRKYQKRNILVGLGLTAGVLGIYFYSMFAVKQENFLDKEFDEPITSNKNQTSN